MALTIIDAGSGSGGVYVGGYNIAPDVYLVHNASSYDEAWEALVEAMADAGQLAPCDDPGCAHEGGECEYVDGHDAMVTADVVLRIIRPSRFD